MILINLEGDLTIEISEEKEFYIFAQKVLDLHLYVDDFSMRKTLSQIIENKDRKRTNILNQKIANSFISLLKFKNEYIGCCNFLLFHPCTLQTFIRENFRGNGFGYSLIKEIITFVRNKEGVLHGKKMENYIKLHHGNEESMILFYKLWKNKVIILKNILEDFDKDKLSEIKKRINGNNKIISFKFGMENEINRYIDKEKASME